MNIIVPKTLYTDTHEYLGKYWSDRLFDKNEITTTSIEHLLKTEILMQEGYSSEVTEDLRVKYSNAKYDNFRLIYLLAIILIAPFHNYNLMPFIFISVLMMGFLVEFNLVNLKKYNNQKHMYANGIVKEINHIAIVAYQARELEQSATLILQLRGGYQDATPEFSMSDEHVRVFTILNETQH